MTISLRRQDPRSAWDAHNRAEIAARVGIAKASLQNAVKILAAIRAEFGDDYFEGDDLYYAVQDIEAVIKDRLDGGVLYAVSHWSAP